MVFAGIHREQDICVLSIFSMCNRLVCPVLIGLKLPLRPSIKPLRNENKKLQ